MQIWRLVRAAHLGVLLTNCNGMMFVNCAVMLSSCGRELTLSDFREAVKYSYSMEAV